MEKLNKKKLNKEPMNREKAILYIQKVLMYGRRISDLNTFDKMSNEILKVSEGVLTEEEIFNFLLQAEMEFK